MIELTIRPKIADLGDFKVQRVLPAAQRRMVGPFIFFDHFGPVEFPPGKGVAVRPHPHIGLATITYLFEGEMIHRDSLGYVQSIQPGAVNLMTAGRGIVHSERSGEDLDRTAPMHGIQSWLALPDGREEMEPGFTHFSADSLPELNVNGVAVRLVIGEAYGRRSPVPTHVPTLYLVCRMPAGSELLVPGDYQELAVFTAAGQIDIEQDQYLQGLMAVTAPGQPVQVRAVKDSLVVVIGGDPVGKRHVWWNFVSSSKERIEQAKADWKNGKFDPVPGDPEFIPLPE